MTDAQRRLIFRTALLTAAYVAAGRFGLLLDAVSGFAALVWIPSGLSLAALLRLGYGVWPGIAVGAFIVNLWAGAPLLAAVGIATGNTLEALTGAFLLCRVPGFDLRLSRVRDVIGLTLLAAGLSTTLGATIGVASLRLAGLVAAGEPGSAWVSWWLGDVTGVLLIAPLLLAWLTSPLLPRRRVWAAGLLILALIGAAGMVFLRRTMDAPLTFLQPYILFAPMIWASLRFMTPGAATANFCVSAVAVAGTVMGYGPFTVGSLHERLLALDGFIGLIGITFPVLGALAKERADVNTALRDAKEAAEAASGAKSRFFAVMSHELRTPLTSIVGYADLLESEIAGPLDEVQKRHVSRIRAAAWHLVSIIDGILTFSRAEAGRDTAEIETVDPGALSREVVALLEPQAATKGLTLRVLLRWTPTLRTDPGKLRQILLNLVGNAVKYSHQGVVQLETENVGGDLVFRVSDQGPGIPRDQLDSIFEPFSQVRGRVTDVSTGTGLGLTVASMLTKLLGGTLAVDSVVGEGSTFTVRLPVDGGVKAKQAAVAD
jgi:signal transduction histidine kinase